MSSHEDIGSFLIILNDLDLDIHEVIVPIRKRTTTATGKKCFDAHVQERLIMSSLTLSTIYTTSLKSCLRKTNFLSRYVFEFRLCLGTYVHSIFTFSPEYPLTCLELTAHATYTHLKLKIIQRYLQKAIAYSRTHFNVCLRFEFKLTITIKRNTNLMQLMCRHRNL